MAKKKSQLIDLIIMEIVAQAQIVIWKQNVDKMDIKDKRNSNIY
jgi:hypothetical protein